MKYIREQRLYFVSFVQLILFIPFFRQGFVGSDWDSYGSYASSYLLSIENTYLPSRPPGFPLFEYLISLFVKYEIRVALVIIFLFLIGINFVTDRLLSKKYINDFLYFALLTSPVLLISSFSVIDYVVGLFFSLSALYVARDKKTPELLFLLLIILATATRLSNVIFFAAGIYILKESGTTYKKIILIALTYFSAVCFIYLPAYSLAGGFCFLNLTNTDHDIIQRLGRFFYKQTYLVGLPGFLLLLYLLFLNKSRIKSQSIYLPYLLIFLLFEISFMRLPTEEGHMLPALFMFFFLLSDIKISNKMQVYLFVSIFISNFLYFELVKIDVPNHVENFSFEPRIQKGLLLLDYEERALKGGNTNYHINNAVNQVVDSWKDGGPNC